MRTIYRLAVFLVALLCGVAIADSAADANNASKAKYICKYTAIDVSAHEGLTTGYVWHNSIWVDASGNGHVISRAAAHEKPWTDGLGRLSNEVSSLKGVDDRYYLLVKLTEKPKVPGDDSWALEDRVVTGNRIDVKFEISGKVYDSLLPPANWQKGRAYPPEAFVRRAATIKNGKDTQSLTIGTMPKDKFLWCPAGGDPDSPSSGLVMDDKDGLVKATTPVYEFPFSDRFGGAALVRFGPSGLEWYMCGADPNGKVSHGVSLGYVEEPQPKDKPEIFNPADYVHVMIFAGAKNAMDPKAPGRLPDYWRRYRDSHAFGSSDKPKYVSGGQLWMFITAKTQEYRFNAMTDVLVSDHPFHDQYGNSAGIVPTTPDPVRQIAWYWDPTPDCSAWLWTVRDSCPTNDELNLAVSYVAAK